MVDGDLLLDEHIDASGVQLIDHSLCTLCVVDDEHATTVVATPCRLDDERPSESLTERRDVGWNAGRDDAVGRHRQVRLIERRPHLDLVDSTTQRVG